MRHTFRKATLGSPATSGIGANIPAIMAFLLVFQAGLTFFWTETNPVIALLVLSSLVVVATGLLGDESGNFDFRQPWSLLLVFHFPFWVVGSWSFSLDQRNWTDLLIGAESQINRALLMVSLGFTMIALGYRIGVRFKMRFGMGGRQREWSLSKMLIWGVLGYSACWVIRVEYYRMVLIRPFYDILGSDPISTIARTATTTLPSFFVVAAWTMAYHHRSNRKLYIFCFFLTVCEVLWGVLYGVMKSLIFLPVFLPVLPYMVMRNKVPWIRIVVVAMLLIGVAYPYVEAVREEYFHPNGPPRTEAIKKVFEQGLRRFAPGAESVLGYSQQAVERVSGLWSLCQALQMETDGGLDINGEFYFRSLVGLVPRLIWRSKPIIHEGGYFGAYIGGHRGLDSVDFSQVTTSVAPTLFGSFFWNLGWWGVVLSSLALGLLSGAAYRWARYNQMSHPSTILYYIAILKCLETTENEVAHFLGSLIWGLAMAWAANWVLSKREPTKRVGTRRGRGRKLEQDAPPAAATDTPEAASRN